MNDSSSLQRTGLKTLLFLTSALLASAAIAADAESGKELYHEVDINQTVNGVTYSNANCESCHESSVYTRPDRLASSYAKLESYVERCNTNLDVGWFPEDVSDVAAYLNQEFYKHPAE